MQVIPLLAVPSQTFTVPLSGQRCQINVYQKNSFPYLINQDVLRATNELGQELTLPPGYYADIGAATDLSLVVTPRVYLDLSVNDTLILAGAPCLAGVPIVRDAYFGFIGELVFYDSQGLDDPVYTGLGSRWFLAYLTAAGS